MLSNPTLVQLSTFLLATACLTSAVLPQSVFAQQQQADQQTAGDATAQPEPLTWENLDAKASEFFQQTGLDGALLVTRNGEIVLSKGYGKANRAQEIANTPDTIFAIGSCPIDFTRAALLLLRDRGKLQFDDPITRFFDNVPEDKRAITIQHLMTGASGLQEFHHLSDDENHDHTYIDRDEAVRRILAQELLFKPGQGGKSSHSAWGLLAAIVEIQSGQTYPEFTREHLFQPAGMNDTGFFGDEFSEERVAVGYGYRASSDPNSPPHWGKTSWLVMGSGGQVSTLQDIHRWEVAMHSGKILSEKSTGEFVAATQGDSADGDRFGFEFCHTHNPESLFLLITNSMDSREELQAFYGAAQALLGLVDPPPPYTLGLSLAEWPEGIIIQEVDPGGSGKEAGLQSGDVLLSAGGEALNATSVYSVLGKYLKDGKPITFKVKRDGKELEVTLTPKLRDE